MDDSMVEPRVLQRAGHLATQSAVSWAAWRAAPTAARTVACSDWMSAAQKESGLDAPKAGLKASKRAAGKAEMRVGPKGGT